VEAFSTAITSNLFGGIGYFYGTSIEDRSSVEEVDDDEDTVSSERSQGRPIVTEPRELLTATPSRSFFPRGFYWCVFWKGTSVSSLKCFARRDEGFHLLLIGEWDNDLR
jgi:mannosyl-oligosaccharide glucosidase